MEELLKKILEQLEYQTKLLETLTTSMDAAQKKGQMGADKMKAQSLDMLSKMMGNHPAVERMKHMMGTKGE